MQNLHGIIPKLFDFWAFPVVHLHLQKSSMDQLSSPAVKIASLWGGGEFKGLIDHVLVIFISDLFVNILLLICLFIVEPIHQSQC